MRRRLPNCCLMTGQSGWFKKGLLGLGGHTSCTKADQSEAGTMFFHSLYVLKHGLG